MDLQQYLADITLKTMSRVHRVIDGDRVVLVASKGGDDRDPDWYFNMVAHPEVELTMGGRRQPVRARRATRQEKAELWPRVVAASGLRHLPAPHPPRHPLVTYELR
jgi:deazaflavin-dependent oxidoreductase (nitroreductase family)